MEINDYFWPTVFLNHLTKATHALERSTTGACATEVFARGALLEPDFLPSSLAAATRFAVALRSLILGSGLEGPLAFFATVFCAAVFLAAVFFLAVFFAGVRFVGIATT